jgi:uncharacterized protein (TIGR00369 family)
MSVEHVAEIFHHAAIIDVLEIQCELATTHECVARLRVGAQHRQHLGLVHGGVVTTLAGHAAAGAATALLPDDEYIVASGFHGKLLAPVRSGTLRAFARVTETTTKGFVVEALVKNYLTEMVRDVARFTFDLVRRRTSV